MKKNPAWQLAAATVMFAVAAILLVRFIRQQREPQNMAYFYDLSEKKLFAAPRTSIPPIRGINDSVEDAVRAVVVATNGNPKDATARTIAYLEMYSPELKAHFEGMRTSSFNAAAVSGHGAAQTHILVRRLDDPNWFSANSAAAQQIMSEWQRPGANGKAPVICVP